MECAEALEIVSAQINRQSRESSKSGVFAGGDAVSGSASVIEAIAAGRKAASPIDTYLGGEGIIDQVLAPVEETSGWLGKDEGFSRTGRD